MNNSMKFIFITVLALASFFLFISFQPFLVHEEKLPQSKVQSQNKTSNCHEGEIVNCTSSNNCTGYRRCVRGQWSECIINVICKPGSKTGCFINSCKTGYAICNRCGTAYENCTPS